MCALGCGAPRKPPIIILISSQLAKDLDISALSRAWDRRRSCKTDARGSNSSATPYNPGGEGRFQTVLLGAGLALIIRILASAIGYVSIILLARWMGPSDYGLYSFAIAWIILLAYPATLGLPGAAVRFIGQYAAANDWQHVVGFMQASSWLAFGCGALIASLTIPAVLYFKPYLNPDYVAPTIVALAGIPFVALTIVRSEAIRGSRMASACAGTSSTRTTSITPHYDGRHGVLGNAVDRRRSGFRLYPCLCNEPYCAMGSVARAARDKDKS